MQEIDWHANREDKPLPPSQGEKDHYRLNVSDTLSKVRGQHVPVILDEKATAFSARESRESARSWEMVTPTHRSSPYPRPTDDAASVQEIPGRMKTMTTVEER